MTLEDRILASAADGEEMRRIGDDCFYWKPFDRFTSETVLRVVGARVAFCRSKNGTSTVAELVDVAQAVTESMLETKSSAGRAWCPAPVFRDVPGLMAVDPSIAGFSLLAPSSKWLKDAAWFVCPGAECEVGIDESREEALFHFEKCMWATDWSRLVSPFVRMRFKRVKKKVASGGGKKRHVFKWPEVKQQFELLARDDGFMELTNYEGSEARLDHDGRYMVTMDGQDKVPLEPGAAEKWLDMFCMEGQQAATKVLGG